nr:hypothetical protein [Tanacetum cinerariifolium]
MTRVVKDQGEPSHMFNDDFYTCMFACFLSQEEPKRVHQALKDPSWIEAMQKELLQFKMQKVWVLVELPHGKRAIGELTFFLGLQVKQQKDGIFISQDKYVAEILRKFGLTEGKSASTPIDIEEPLLKDPDGEDVDVHTYRSMIGSLMYLTSLRLYIMFAVCTCAHFQVTPKASHLHAVKRIFRYLKGKHHLGLWYLKDSPFDLVAYLDSDYAGASLDRKFTTRGCQFLGCILISWQCKKQTVVATSSIEAEYVAAASCCVNDVTRLQALVDKKKVVVTEAAIREVLYLDDAEGVDCLPNEEIFAELARMGYEKPSTKLTFYKAFFSSQWKFLIHTILQCMSAKRTLWNEFSSSMASAIICLSSGRKFNFSKYIFDSLVQNVDSTTKFYMYPRFLQLIIRKQVGDLLTHTTKYTSPTLIHKVFANIRRVGKGFFGVETPLFKGMLVDQEVDEEGDADEHVKKVNTGDAAQGDDSAAHGEVPAVQPPSPQHKHPPQPQQAADFPMSLLQEAIDACAALTRRVEHLEYDKVAQALEITKLKRRVKKLEKRNNGRMIAEMDQDDAIVLKDDKEEDKKIVDKDVKEAKVDESAQDQGRQAESEAKIYKIDMDHANKVLSMQEDETEPAEVQEVVDVVTTSKLITKVITAASETVTAASAIITTAEVQVPTATLTVAPAPSKRRKGVVIRDPELKSTTSIIIPAETNPKKKDEAIDHVKRKAKEDPAVKRYQVLKRKPQTKAQARKSMIMYLKNVVGFKMDYFKGMSYDDIRSIFEAKFNSNVAFLLKTKEHIEEEENRALQKLNETPTKRAAKRRKLDEEVHVVDYQLYISFLSLLRNFDREDLEALWRLVKEKFSTTKPKKFSEDFLLVTLGAMFKKPNIHAQIWKTQINKHGPSKVKGWKLLESCGVQIITFTYTQLILLVDRKYPLTIFTLDQMLNAVRLKVEEESEVSLELLRFIRQQHQEGQLE